MPHWLFHWLGGDGGSIYDYGSALIPDLALLSVLGIVWRKLNCGEPGCYRIGRHHMVDDHGQQHHVCRHHHPTGGPPRGLKHHHLHHRQLEG